MKGKPQVSRFVLEMIVKILCGLFPSEVEENRFRIDDANWMITNGNCRLPLTGKIGSNSVSIEKSAWENCFAEHYPVADPMNFSTMIINAAKGSEGRYGTGIGTSWPEMSAAQIEQLMQVISGLFDYIEDEIRCRFSNGKLDLSRVGSSYIIMDLKLLSQPLNGPLCTALDGLNEVSGSAPWPVGQRTPLQIENASKLYDICCRIKRSAPWLAQAIVLLEPVPV